MRQLIAIVFFSMFIAACDSSTSIIDIDTDATNSPDAGPPSTGPALEPVFGAATGSRDEVGQWGEVIPWPHVAVSMANLPDGRVLSYSGSERRTWPTTEQTYSSTWDPVSGVFEENFFRGHNMFCAALSLTSDGRVLVSGGRNSGNSPWTSLYDYDNGSWQAVQNMASGGRWYPTTLSLGDGNVMTSMGSATNVRNPDLWNADDGWRVLNGVDFLTARSGRSGSTWFPQLSLTPDGNVYHYWDPERSHMINVQGNGTTRSANAISDGGGHAPGVQLMYDEGKLLMTGQNDGSWNGSPSNKAFTIDLNGSVPVIAATDNMRHQRSFNQLVPLPTGEVLVVGGNTTGAKFRDDGSVMEPEIWNPQNGQWRGVANMSVPRDYHSTAILLTDGRVVVAGGGYSAGNANSSGTHQDGQIFSPPYLFSGNSPASRPSVIAAEASVDTGQWFEVTTTGNVQSFSFIKMSATTHSVNTDARFYRPQFEAIGNNSFRVRVHPNPNVSVPGYWMLFALDDQNVPSEAQVIRVTAVDTRLDNLAAKGSATQSSTAQAQYAANSAIDGDLSGALSSGSVAQTNNDAQAWWELDLGREVEIDTIRVWNRTDALADRLADFHVLVSSQPFTSTELNPALAQDGVIAYEVNGVAGRQTDLSINSFGRYVRVQLQGTNPLQLAEVQVFGKTSKPVRYEYYEGTWDALPDFSALAPVATGNLEDFSIPPVSRAENFGFRLRSRLSVSTPGEYTFSTNSDDGSQLFINDQLVVDNDGLHGARQIEGKITLTPGEYSIMVTFFQKGGAAGLTASWSGPGFTERAIHSLVAPREDFSNVALNKTATQSSTYPTYPAANAVNGYTAGNSVGNNNTGITHTNLDQNAWWEVDLGEVMELDSVVIYNRSDCCAARLSDYHVLISDTPFISTALDATIAQQGVSNTRVNGPNGAARTLLLNSTTGRYLRIQLAGTNFLSLGEVEIIGAPISQPLAVSAIDPSPQQIGNTISVTADAVGRAPFQYSWNFGDGSADTPFTSAPNASYDYAAPGRYVVSVTVRDASGDEVRQTFTQIVHEQVLTSQAMSSGNLLEIPARNQLWNTNPDNNTVTVTDTSLLTVVAEIATGAEPVSLAMGPDNRVWVVNREAATISVIDPASLTVSGNYALPRASLPYGIVTDSTYAYIALEATGQVVKLTAGGSQATLRDVGAGPRNLTLDSDSGKLYVSRFITPLLPGEDTGNPIVDDGVTPYGGEVLVLGTAGLTIEDTIIVEHSNRTPSENQGPGIPNYLGAVAISPTGNTAWVPSKQDNILSGEVRGGTELAFDQTVRAITSKLDLNTNVEFNDRRVDHDNASVAHSAAFDPYGTTLFVTLEGNRQVALIDTSTAIEIGRIDTGFAPQGIIVSEDGTRLYVHNYTDRSISVFDITEVVDSGATEAAEVTTVGVVSNEQLDSIVLRGKQLFHDARDDRLAALDYMSCASCHVDGSHDGRVWDFTALGEGLRNTITLNGRKGMGHGMLHWTGNFDELQDFEGQLRDFAGGLGLMDDVSFAQTSDPLGAPKAGLSEDLDALAAYMTSLDSVPPSPWKNADGSFTSDAATGQLLFAASGCATCHSGEIFTDSNDAVLNDVGTAMADSGNRMGGPLTGFDTPTLLGVWNTAPYLHDGSAATLQDAISAHLNVTFNTTQLDQLAAYLSQLDDSNNEVVDPPIEPPTPSNPLTDGAITVDGILTEWSTVRSFTGDPADADNNNPIDWISAAIAHDSSNYYISYTTDSPVVDSWGYAIFIDTDGNPDTGFSGFGNEYPIGADYLIEAADVQRYTGTGDNWSWVFAGSALRGASGNSAELSVPRTMLGNAQMLQLFLRGDNSALSGTVIDFYPDTVTDATAVITDRLLTYTTVQSQGNTPPLANNQTLAVAADSTLPIVLTANDANNDALIFEVADQPANGVLSGTGPNRTYTPDAGFTGADSFTFTAYDGADNSNLALVNITVQGQPPSNTLAITVDGDLAEWVGSESFGLDAADANGLNDDIDWQRGWMAHDADNLYIAYQNYDSVIDSWGNGIYIDTDGNRATGFTGFGDEYPIGADVLIEAATVLSYTGSGQNWSWDTSAGVDYAISAKVAELAVPLQLLNNPQSIQLFFLAENAAVGGSSIDYYPDGVTDVLNPVRFHSYTVDSGAVNRPPIANGLSLQTQADTAVDVQLSGSDPENAALSYQIRTQPLNGSLTGTAPNLSYTPDSGFTGADSFTFSVSDGENDSLAAVVAIDVEVDQLAPAYAVSNDNATIVVDGDLSEWAALNGLVSDAAESGELDWKRVWVANDASSFFLGVEMHQPVDALTWGHQFYLDTDQQATTGFKGFSGEFAIGADYLLEGSTLVRYTGSGNDWSWEFVATVQAGITGDSFEIGIPRTLLDNVGAFEMIMKADAAAVNGATIDWYPDGVAAITLDASERKLRYSVISE